MYKVVLVLILMVLVLVLILMVLVLVLILMVFVLVLILMVLVLVLKGRSRNFSRPAVYGTCARIVQRRDT